MEKQLLDNIAKFNLKDDTVVCLCNDITIGDIKNKIIKFKSFSSFEDFIKKTESGDVCELCQCKEYNNSGMRKVSLEELYLTH